MRGKRFNWKKIKLTLNTTETETDIQTETGWFECALEELRILNITRVTAPKSNSTLDQSKT